jgi:hypothetical protein
MMWPVTSLTLSTSLHLEASCEFPCPPSNRPNTLLQSGIVNFYVHFLVCCSPNLRESLSHSITVSFQKLPQQRTLLWLYICFLLGSDYHQTLLTLLCLFICLSIVCFLVSSVRNSTWEQKRVFVHCYIPNIFIRHIIDSQ